MNLTFKGGKVLTPNGWADELFVKDGQIADQPVSSAQEIDCSGLLVLPGLIDLQVNGFGSHDLTRNPAGYLSLADLLLKQGVTFFLPTLVSSPKSVYEKITTGLWHLEGPFLNPDFCGAHSRASIEEGRIDFFWEKLLLSGHVGLITIAPEHLDFSKVHTLARKQGIAIAIGHTAGLVPSDLDIDMVTHLFNAMGQFHHRNPKLIGEVLGSRRYAYSLIADGEHLHPHTVRMAYNSHPDGLILVSDFVADTVGGEKIQGRLSGGKASLLECVKNLIEWTDCSLEFAWNSATSKPAKILKMDSQKGALGVSMDADIICVEHDSLMPHSVYLKGIRMA